MKKVVKVNLSQNESVQDMKAKYDPYIRYNGDCY